MTNKMYYLNQIKKSQQELEEKRNSDALLDPKEEELYKVQESVIDFCELIERTDGYRVDDIDLSGASMSTYVTIEETQSGELFSCKVRFSNHAAKPYHNSHDIDINTGGFLKDEAQRVFDFINEELEEL